MKLIITGTRSLPDDCLVWLTLKLDRLTAKLDHSKLTVLVRMVEGPVQEWAFRGMITHLIFHGESDQDMVKQADAIIVVRGPKRKVRDAEGLVREAERRKLKIRTIEWKDKK